MPRTGGTGGGGGIQYLHSLSFGLFLQARTHPAIWDVIPQVPKYSRGTLDVIASQIIKAVAYNIKEPQLKEQLNRLGAVLYSTGTKTMSYDDDWFCGNSPLPVPPRFEQFEFLNFSAIEFNPSTQLSNNYYGAILTIVADSINHTAIATSLKNIASSLVESN